jgi:DNA-directed RNA polymerase subunit N (RpoN/RPB10)
MLIPIRCISCSAVIADKYNFYIKRLKEKKQLENTKNEKNSKITIDDLHIDNDDILNKHFDKNLAKDILDQLEIHRYCCRRMFLGNIDLIEHI